MAATNAYYTIQRIPGAGGDVDEAVFTGTNPLASGTSSTFTLKGGTYTVDLIASTYGTVTLQRLGPDGSTWITAMTAFAANAAGTSATLPAGTYRIVLA